MKNIIDIYEGILGNVDDVLATGDNLDSIVQGALKELSKELSMAKNYEKMPAQRVYKNGRFTKYLVAPELFAAIGYDANHIEITMYQIEDELNNPYDWSFRIYISKKDEYGQLIGTAYNVNLYLYDGVFPTLKDVIKKLIKPMTSDIKTFKKSLENMQKREGQLVTQPYEILK